MGYTHFWERKGEFDREPFLEALEDIKVILARMRDLGVKLAGPNGHGKPEITGETIAFNGSATCGHRYRDLGKPFASVIATGIEEKEPPYDPNAAPWFSGPFLDTRVCGGSCAAEPFVVDRKYLVRDWERADAAGLWSCSCETHFKPYDLAVTASLIRLKERLGDAIRISSENPDHGFDDAKRLCRELFGWGAKFELERQQTEILR